MTDGQAGTILRYFRKLVAAETTRDASDGQLLRRFTADHDQAAFAALVGRHGGLVWAVCRRVLRHEQDAEDSFQATFLVLARKAASIRKGQSLASWLYGVAYRIAQKANTSAARRRRRERRAAGAPPEQPGAELALRELQVVLDEELNRLPAKYRAPFVLCCLEGKTKREAAQELGWKEGTVSTRIGQARKQLQQRLTRRGVTLSAVLSATAVAHGRCLAVVPAAIVTATVQGAVLFVAGETAKVVSAPAAGLAREALRGVGVMNLKSAGAVALVLAAVTVGAGMAARQALPAKQASARQEAARPPAEGTAQAAKGDAGRKERADWYGDPLPPGILARMGTVQLRQESARAQFAADGKTLISVGVDQVVRFWDVATGKQVRQWQLPSQGASKVYFFEGGAFTRDGKLLAVWGSDQAIHLLDTATGEERHRLPAGRIGHMLLAISSDGKVLAGMLGLGGRYVTRLWDGSTGKERVALRERSYIAALAFSPDGKLLASSQGQTGHQSLTLWDAATGQELRTARTEGGAVAFSPEGKTVAAGNRFGTVALLEVATLRQQATLKPATASWTSSGLTYSSDATVLAVAGDKDVVLWEVAARKERRRLPQREARQLVFAPDGRSLACLGAHEIHLWDVTTGERLHNRPGHDGHVQSVDVSPDGKVVASASMDDSAIRLWDAVTGQPLSPCLHHSDCVRSAAFSSDGRLVLSGGLDGTLRLWETATGKGRRQFMIEDVDGGPRRQEVLVCHLSADGKRLAAVSSTWDKALDRRRYQVSAWDAESGRLLARRPFAGGLSSRFTPDGQGVSVNGSQCLTIEETATGRVRTTVPGDLGGPVAFSPDGRLVAVGVRETLAGPSDEHGWKPLGLRMAEVATGQEVFHVEGWIEFASFSPDGRVLATADPKALRLWDAVSGQQLFHRPWPEGLAHTVLQTPIGSLALLPSGRAAATGMGDGTILVWDLAPETWPATEPAGNLARKELDALWSDLAAGARKGQRAVRTLAMASAQAVPFLKDHLQPVADADPQRVRQLVADLDSERFAVRETAARELAGFGAKVEPVLHGVLARQPSLEVRRRVEKLLSTLHTAPSAAVVRTLRAIQALERIGTPDARQVLKGLAAGAPAARETREAQGALERLERGR
jgi:RNA polymerase sigma factor (sigma-70 family)